MISQKTGAENVRWDLNSLYSGLDDPQLGKDIAEIVERSRNFASSHKGKLTNTLGEAITDYSEIRMLESKVMLFLYLKQSVNVADSAVKAQMAEAEKTLSQSEGDFLIFFDIEIVALTDEALEKLYSSNPVVARHRSWIEHIRVFKPHVLSEPVESALTKRSPFGPDAWGEFFDELEADLGFEYKGEKKTLTEMVHVLCESKNQQERSDVAAIVNSGLRWPFAKYSAQTLYMVTGSNEVEGKERNYSHPMEPRNKSNRVPDAVVNALHAAVMNVGGPLARRYYKLKAAHLGLKTLKWSDRNAPMPFADTAVIPFDEALKTVIAAYESFSPTLAGLINGLVAAKSIDAPAEKGKRGGAFNYSVVLPGKTPVSFTFLDYLGSSRDVIVLAHELGHGVHGLLAGKEQGVLMSHVPIVYCELASEFGETTTIKFLRKKLVDKDDLKSELTLVMREIENVINVTVRQIGLSNFERRIHGIDPLYQKWGTPKKLSVEELNAIWLETVKQLYGEEGEVFTYENTGHLWSSVGHFHRPFYIYSYAFGQLLTQSIYARQKDFSEKFEPLYLDMLKSGSTKNVTELLKPFGLNPADEKFWADGINNGLGEMIKEAERLSRKMGLSV